ncbi:uncharacterized protein LOC134529911 [Bacillus rossius redtenbacheri]|uniref:uncharacterized protein LOC134529911 n=1 Tax=Bacillus rossius redtenbacheri TaxID=93214 RepID=UPI002FDD9664
MGSRARYYVVLGAGCCLLAVAVVVFGQAGPPDSPTKRSYNLSFVSFEIKSWNTKYVKNVKKSYFYVNKNVKNKGVTLSFELVRQFTNEIGVFAEYWHRKDDQSPWSVKNTLMNISLCDVVDTADELWQRMYSMVKPQMPKTCPWPLGSTISVRIDILEDKFPPKMPGREFHICLVFYERLPPNLPEYGHDKKLLEIRAFVRLVGEN